MLANYLVLTLFLKASLYLYTYILCPNISERLITPFVKGGLLNHRNNNKERGNTIEAKAGSIQLSSEAITRFAIQNHSSLVEFLPDFSKKISFI